MKYWLLPLLFLALVGCGSKKTTGMPPGWTIEAFPPEYTARMVRLDRDGMRNKVLNLYELALEALRREDRETAKLALDEALLEIEVLYGNSDQARRARSLWRSEDDKIYKGDPYERSMAYFYRGVLFMQDAEWDQARACFRSAIIQDTLSQQEEYNADWATFEYLIGVCETRLGRPGHAREAFERATLHYAAFRDGYPSLDYAPRGGSSMARRISFGPELPGFDESTNLLVISQQGNAPDKIALGEYGELLGFAPGGGGGTLRKVHLDGRPLGSVITDSVFYQAKTRGGRPLDSILKGQARFKKVGEDVGAGSAAVGAGILMQNNNKEDNDTATIVGAGLIAFGAISYGIASLVRPEADTREWATLPESIALWTGSLPEESVTLEALPLFSDQTIAKSISLPRPQEGVEVVLVFAEPWGTILTRESSNLTTTERTQP
ncbi:MAG: tetratricopeptide repeat protein [Candidatus Sumerlaeia bacterium]|nr:tetratricopeptide repeat protein [Candidatus Sumerlaeia bacterium]